MSLKYQHFRCEYTSSALKLFVVYLHSVFQVTQEVVVTYRGVRWTTWPCLPAKTEANPGLENKLFMSDEAYFHVNSDVKRQWSEGACSRPRACLKRYRRFRSLVPANSGATTLTRHSWRYVVGYGAVSSSVFSRASSSINRFEESCSGYVVCNCCLFWRY
jgi:hypothetical protein